MFCIYYRTVPAGAQEADRANYSLQNKNKPIIRENKTPRAYFRAGRKTVNKAFFRIHWERAQDRGGSFELYTSYRVASQSLRLLCVESKLRIVRPDR